MPGSDFIQQVYNWVWFFGFRMREEMSQRKEEKRKESERRGKRERREIVPLLLPPTDTDSVTIETFNSLNLISPSTLPFSSLSLSFNHSQVPLPTVACNCYSSREKKRGRKRRCDGKREWEGGKCAWEMRRKGKRKSPSRAIVSVSFFSFYTLFISFSFCHPPLLLSRDVTVNPPSVFSWNYVFLYLHVSVCVRVNLLDQRINGI